MIDDSDFGLFSIRFLRFNDFAVWIANREEIRQSISRLRDFLLSHEVDHNSRNLAKTQRQRKRRKKKIKSGTMTHVINRRKFHTQLGQNRIAFVMAWNALLVNLAVASIYRQIEVAFLIHFRLRIAFIFAWDA